MAHVVCWLVSLDTLRLSSRRIDVGLQAGAEQDADTLEGASVFAVVELHAEDIVPYHSMFVLQPAEKVQLKFWQQLVGRKLSGAAYVVRFRRIAPLPQKIPLLSASARKCRGLLVTLDEHVGPQAKSALGNAAAWMGDAIPSVALRAPAPHLDNICSLAWQSIVMPHIPVAKGSSSLQVSWERSGLLVQDFPDHACADREAETAETLALDQDVLDVAVDALKECASHLDPNDDFQRVEYESLRRAVHVLEETSDALDEGVLARAARDLVGVTDAHAQSSRRQFQAAYLVKVLVMSSTLRSSGSLRESVMKAMQLVLPPVLLQPFQKVLEASAKQFPHEATISRWRLLLDGSFMLLQRRANVDDKKSDCARYLLADSSLQHRRDFEHIMVAQIERSNLGFLWQKAEELTSLWLAHKLYLPRPKCK